MNRTVFSKYAAGLLLGITVVAALAVEEVRPAKLSTADLSGAMFKGPQVKRVAAGGRTELEVDTLTSTDKKFQTGSYQAGPEHEDYTQKGFADYEFIYVLEGTIELTDSRGVQVIGPGEAASIPK